MGRAEPGERGPPEPAGLEAARERDPRTGELAARRALSAFAAAPVEARHSDIGLDLPGTLVGSLSHSDRRAVKATG